MMSGAYAPRGVNTYPQTPTPRPHAVAFFHPWMGPSSDDPSVLMHRSQYASQVGFSRWSPEIILQK